MLQGGKKRRTIRLFVQYVPLPEWPIPRNAGTEDSKIASIGVGDAFVRHTRYRDCVVPIARIDSIGTVFAARSFVLVHGTHELVAIGLSILECEFDTALVAIPLVR